MSKVFLVVGSCISKIASYTKAEDGSYYEFVLEKGITSRMPKDVVEAFIAQEEKSLLDLSVAYLPSDPNVAAIFYDDGDTRGIFSTSEESKETLDDLLDDVVMNERIDNMFDDLFGVPLGGPSITVAILGARGAGGEPEDDNRA